MANITKTIGTTGRDYSTVTAWEADLDDTGIYSAADVAIGEMYNDSAFEENITINGGSTVGLAAISLVPATGQEHDGTEGTGVHFLSTGTNTVSIELVTTVPVTITLIEIDGNDFRIDTFCVKGNASSTDHTFNRGIVHGIHAVSQGIQAFFCDFKPLIVTNTAIYDLLTTTGTCIGLRMKGQSSTFRARAVNVTILNVTQSTSGGGDGIVGTNNSNNQYENTISMDCDQDFTQIGGSPIVSHLMSSDTTATGTGSLISKVSTNQFVSTTGGSEDLHIKTGADAIAAGVDLVVTPTGVNIDIDGRDRDAQGDTWDMGADQFVTTGAALIKMVNETLNISENTNKVLGIIRNIGEALNISETNNRIMSLVRNINETVQITEIQNRVMSLVRMINETVNITDIQNRLKGIIRSVNETLQLSESNNSVIGLVKNISETINITETQNKIKGIIKNISETVQISEIQNRLSNLVRNISETVQIQESKNRLSNLVRNVNETIQFTEGVNRLKGIIRSVNETLQMSELNNSVKGLIRNVNETLNITENTNKVTGIIKTINETLQMSEIQNKTRNLVRVISETIQINEIQNKTRNLVRNITESLQLSETQNRTMNLVRFVNETIQLSESSGVIRGLIKVVNEIVNFAEVIIKKLGVPPTVKVKPTTDSITFARGCDSIVLNRGCNSIIIS